MCVLTREEILREIRAGRIKIEPFEENQVGPGSIDLTLDNKFRIYKEIQDVFYVREDSDPNELTRTIEVRDAILLKPSQTIHGITKEKITLPSNICGWIEGRSRFARLGLLVHITSGFVQPGVSNRQVLEIGNVSPVPLKIKPGIRICQLVLERTEGKAVYKGKFLSQEEP
jgi:dCTP deaminase